MLNKTLRQLKFNRSLLVPVLVIFGVIGAILLVRSFAATGEVVAFETEQGTVSGNAKASNGDATASGGSYVTFKPTTGTTPPPPPSVATTYPAPGEVGFKGDPNSLQIMGANNGAGSLSLSGGTFTNVKITAPIYWSGGNLTLRNCIVDVGNSSTGAIFAASGGTLDIDNCTIKNGTVNSSGIIHGAAIKIIRNSDLSGGADGVNAANPGSIFEHNYIHNLGVTSVCNEVHNDGFQVYGSSNLLIKYNRVEMNYDACNTNAGVFTQGGSSSQQITIEGNYFKGTGWALAIQSGGAAVRNNVFSRQQLFGACTTNPGGRITEWTNNKWEDGAAISGCQ